MSPAPIKRCRVDASPGGPKHHLARSLVYRDDVTDDEDDWNKENRRPERRHCRRRDDCDVSSRCADRDQDSPANHIYHTLEPSADCRPRPAADRLFSPVYETIDSDDVVDTSTVLRGQHRNDSKLLSTSRVSTERRQVDSELHKTKKRVTFNVSIRTRRF